jgi:hypothetical protein
MIYLCAGGVPHIIGKLSTKATTLLQISLQSMVCKTMYGPPKLRKFQFCEYSKQNDIWVQAPWPNTKNTIKGKGWLPPNPRCNESCEFMFVYGSSMHQNCSNYALTNLLFSLCRSMWIIDSLVTRPNLHPETPTCPSTPEVLRTRECTPTFYPFVIFTLDTQLSL